MLSPSDPAGERTRTHSALASTSRIHILSLLRDSDTPLDIAQIAARSALHPNTVRFHLRILVGAGLACCRTDPRGSSGRPRLVYTAAADGPGSHHPEGFQLLADILASYLAASPTIPPGLAEQAGHAYVRRHRRPALPTADVSADEAVRQVVAMFTELGFEPELAPQGQDIQIRLHACPFQAIARRYPEIVCSMHLGLLRGTLAELEAPVTAQGLQPFVESHLCVAYLRAAIESAPDADNPLVSSVGKDRSHGNLD